MAPGQARLPLPPTPHVLPTVSLPTSFPGTPAVLSTTLIQARGPRMARPRYPVTPSALDTVLRPTSFPRGGQGLAVWCLLVLRLRAAPTELLLLQEGRSHPSDWSPRI